LLPLVRHISTPHTVIQHRKFSPCFDPYTQISVCLHRQTSANQLLNLEIAEHFTTKIGYGYVYAFMGVTSAKETSFAMISALIPNDTPRQVEWHLTGAVRNGATVEEVRGVREIALKIAIKAGVPLKNEVPDI
jgi:alkylhydroperoxidase/carboxymuconolactone decarboxylase family protein YurZ